MDKVRISGSTVGVICRVIVTRLVWLVSLLRLHQDILYDYTADLTGIGDRSVHVTEDE